MIGQADSVRLGLARAILKMDPELRMELSHAGFLSRDAREKERKKPGLERCPQGPDLHQALVISGWRLFG